MVEIAKPFSKVLFNKRNYVDEITDVDWLSWSLTRKKDELHELQVELTYPLDWIDFDADTGMKATIGDEIGLWASWGQTLDQDSKRFGGYISGISGAFDGSAKITFTAKDFRYSLQNRQVFRDYYRVMPIKTGMYGDYVNKLFKRTSLYTHTKDLCTYCGFTDFSLLENPHAWSLSEGQPFTRTLGTYSTSTTITGVGSGKSTKLSCNSKDSSIAFTIYDDAQGYDGMAYPHLSIAYHLPKWSSASVGFRFTINGTYYYVPWRNSLTSYSGNKLRGLVPKFTKNFEILVIPIQQLMNEKYPNTVYNITKIEVISAKSGGIGNGNIYFDNIAPVDYKQMVQNTFDYSYTDMLSALNKLCVQCEHYFEIDPFKRPLLHNINSLITDKAIREGDNLISATLNYEDTELVNNMIVIAGVEDQRGILGQSVDFMGKYQNGEYDKVEETNDLTTNEAVWDYTREKVAKGSYVTPSISCEVKPDFGYKEGEIIYVYIPSLGIEKSLQILSVSWDNTGKCSLDLGNPETELSKFLKQLDANQKSGMAFSNKTIDKALAIEQQGKFSDMYTAPLGRTKIGGSHMIAPGVNVLNDVKPDGGKMWITDGLADNLSITDDYINLSFERNTENWWEYYTSTAEGSSAGASEITASGAWGTYTRDSTHQYSGYYCHKFTITSQNPQNPFVLAQLDGTQALVTGEKYTSSFKIRKEDVLGLTVIPYVNVNGVGAQMGTGVTVDASTIEDNGYIQLDVTWTSTVTGNYIVFAGLYGVGTGNTIYVDEMQMSKGDVKPFSPGGARIILPTIFNTNHPKFGKIKKLDLTYEIMSTYTPGVSPNIYIDHYWHTDLQKNIRVDNLYGWSGVVLADSNSTVGTHTIQLVGQSNDIIPLDMYNITNIIYAGGNVLSGEDIRIKYMYIQYYTT